MGHQSLHQWLHQELGLIRLSNGAYYVALPLKGGSFEGH
jgi:hypothetical protein